MYNVISQVFMLLTDNTLHSFFKTLIEKYLQSCILTPRRLTSRSEKYKKKELHRFFINIAIVFVFSDRARCAL